MKKLKLSLAVVVATGVLAVSGNASELGVSANVAMTSDYMWRGMTQTSNSPAIQGGFDLDYEGFYIGTWGSNVSGDPDYSVAGNGYYYGRANMELDLYGGYSSSIAGVEYDVGFLQFFYPRNTEDSGWGEAYLGLSYDFDVVSVGAKYSYAVDTMDNGWDSDYSLLELFIGVPITESLSFDATYGLYDNIGDYYYAGLTQSYKGFDFTVAYTGIEYDNNGGSEGKATFTVGTGF